MDANDKVFNQVADYYETYRPSPPAELPEILIQYAGGRKPSRVVDLGCGSGLSTFVWANTANSVIGIDPNADMLSVAQRKLMAHPSSAGISFQLGSGTATGLADQSVDIVTCAQSFHWMEPQGALAEIARILKPGGIFAAFDYLWPPLVGWQVDQVYHAFIEHAWRVISARGLEGDMHIWSENRQLAILKESALFRHVHEFWLHRKETGDADRFVGLTLTNGVIQPLIKGLLDEDEIQLGQFKKMVQRLFRGQSLPWYFCYHVRVGIL